MWDSRCITFEAYSYSVTYPSFMPGRDIATRREGFTTPWLFIHISDGKMGDVGVPDLLPIETGIW